MTGVMEIKQAVDAIRQAVSTSERIEVLPLHANLTSAEQQQVFRPVKPGHRKVVVATNVAETSITIDGIGYVIDCGRVKENRFDPETSITKLVETWTSKASSRQRRGRAGRTRPGECYSESSSPRRPLLSLTLAASEFGALSVLLGFSLSHISCLI